MSNSRFLDSLTQLIVQGIVTQDSSPSPTLPTAPSTNEFAAIFLNLSDVTKPCYVNHLMTHDITHHNLLLQLLIPQSVHIHDTFLLKSSRLLSRNSSTCYKKVSSNHPLAVGHHSYTWCPKIIQGIEVFAAIIVQSTMPQCQTDTPSLTFEILQSYCLGPTSFPSWT